MIRSRSALLWWILLVGYWIVLAIGTHLPLEKSSFPSLGKADKLAHYVTFGCLALLLAQAASCHENLSRVKLPTWFVLLAGYAAIDEHTQGWVPTRHPDLLDWLADLFGVASGLAAFHLWTCAKIAWNSRSRNDAARNHPPGPAPVKSSVLADDNDRPESSETNRSSP